MAIDPKPLFKLFGDTASVVTQIATDKAVNGRRQTSVSASQDAANAAFNQTNAEYTAALRAAANPANGQLVANVSLSSPSTTVNHNLGRVPVGAIVVAADAANVCAFDRSGTATASTFDMLQGANFTADIWVF